MGWGQTFFLFIFYLPTQQPSPVQSIKSKFFGDLFPNVFEVLKFCW